MQKTLLPSVVQASGGELLSRVLQDGICTKENKAFLVHKQRYRADKVHVFSKPKHFLKLGLLGRRN